MLTDIVTFEGVAMELSFDRGDIGVLVDIQSEDRNEFLLPQTGSGESSEHSFTFVT